MEEDKKDIFIGGAWPYSNYYLHVGHLAALLPGDILAKFFRQNGDNVIYVSGSDCHGTPITERAKKENVEPSEIANYYHEEFVKTFEKLGFEYDKYSNTETKEHKQYVQEKFKEIIKNGYIFEKEEVQDYCDECNKFLSDREIVGTCSHCGGKSSGDQCEQCGDSLDSSEVLDKSCAICGKKTVLRKNKHLYFDLPAFEERLQNLINDRQDKWRKNAIGEAQKYIDTGLVQRAATRQLEWGVPVPVDGYDDKRIYVWIEAVLGYLSVGNEVAKTRSINFDEFMSNDNKNLETYYVHGKDNIPFHTTIYPALLMGINNNYRLPDYIVSSAYVKLNNDKMSKSKGNLITANELLEIFDSDTIRFYFAFKGPESDDINCSLEDIIQTHNKFLVGMFGNFVNRNFSFISKKFNGEIKEGTIDEAIKSYTEKSLQLISTYFKKAEIRNATAQIVEYFSSANKYYDSRKPWIQVNEDIDAFNDTTYTCTYMIANMANMIAPIMPNASEKIKKMLNISSKEWKVEKIEGNYIVNDPQILFKRINEESTSNGKVKQKSIKVNNKLSK